MRRFRGELFESNSSETHTLILLSKDAYEKWKKGDLFLQMEDAQGEYTEGSIKMQLGDNHLYTKEQLKERLKEVEASGRYNEGYIDEALETVDKLLSGELKISDEEAWRKLDEYWYDTYEGFKTKVEDTYKMRTYETPYRIYLEDGKSIDAVAIGYIGNDR